MPFCDDEENCINRCPFPIDHFPIDPFPIDPFPINPFPIDSFPIDPFPIDSFPIDTFPIDLFPIDPFPIDHFPIDHFPIDPFPIDPFPIDPFPIDPFLIDSFPIDPFPVDPFFILFPSILFPVVSLIENVQKVQTIGRERVGPAPPTSGNTPQLHDSYNPATKTPQIFALKCSNTASWFATHNSLEWSPAVTFIPANTNQFAYAQVLLSSILAATRSRFHKSDSP
ncbi:unnamed protein product [Acanthosepion pharaonis]|uniref:Uncharacterized protein n=1 Tax=Acanthosepion pharaonis TaxID=158019 RepID=A0A812DDC5_ACAPH|nr:unnamed protein product [Sepia pharaonis]